jgi:hypothetical protein
MLRSKEMNSCSTYQRDCVECSGKQIGISQWNSNS